MAHDGSIASMTEDYIVAALKAIPFGAGTLFDPESVRPWDGTEKESVEDFSNEFMAGRRDLAATVYFLEDSVEDLEAGEVKVLSTYVILAGVRNTRPELGRRGDADRPGTNRVRDLVRYALHNVRPLASPGVLLNDGVTAVDHLWYGTSAVVLSRKTMVIQRHLIVGHEVPVG